MREPDYAALAEALELGTAEALESTGGVLGVELDHERLLLLNAESKRGLGPGRVGMPRLLALIFRAVRSEEGLASERLTHHELTAHCLVVRWKDGDQELLSLGVRLHRFRRIASVWPELKGWSSKLGANLARAKVWAKSDGKIRLKVRAGQRAELSGVRLDDEEGLRRAVVEAPEHDAPRLVFADWLLERGDSRGEFIRLQCERARPEETATRDARIETMLEASESTFAGAASAYAPRFVRGFVQEVTMTVTAFSRHGESLFLREPIRTLIVKNPKFTATDLQTLADAPALRRVRELELELHHTAVRPPLAPLASSQHFERLEVLRLRLCGHSPDDWNQFFGGIDAPRLEEVALHGGASSGAMYRGLARNPSLLRLRSIRVSNQASFDRSVKAQNARAMAELAALRPSLERFTTWGCHETGDHTFAPFFGASSVVALRELSVTGPGLTDATALLIAKSPKSKSLEIFHVHDGSLSVTALEAALSSSNLPRLHTLAISTSRDEPPWAKAELEGLARTLVRLSDNHPLRTLELPGLSSLHVGLRGELEERFEIPDAHSMARLRWNRANCGSR